MVEFQSSVDAEFGGTGFSEQTGAQVRQLTPGGLSQPPPEIEGHGGGMSSTHPRKRQPDMETIFVSFEFLVNSCDLL
jgi:hypothetical protein